MQSRWLVLAAVAFLAGTPGAGSFGEAVPHATRPPQATGSGDQIDLLSLAGLVIGVGKSAEQRRTNGAILQAAVNDADTHGVAIVCPSEAQIEFDLTGGLRVPVSTHGFTARLNRRCELRQAHADAPILVLGDPSGAEPKNAVWWEGGSFNYVASQAGNRHAVCLLEGSLYGSTLKHMDLCGEYDVEGRPLHPPFDGWDVGSRDAVRGFSFQNDYEDISVGGAQASLYRVQLEGTGSYRADIYMHDGSSPWTAQTLSDTAVYWAATRHGERDDDTCIRCNFEHFKAEQPLYFRIVRGLTFDALHLEDVTLVGSNTSLMTFEGAEAELRQTTMLDLRATGTNLSLARATYGAEVSLDGVYLKWAAAQEFTGSGRLFAGLAGTESVDSNVSFTAERLLISDVGANAAGLTIDPMTPPSLDVLTRFDSYRYSGLLPQTVGATLVAAADLTIYGQHEAATVIVPGTIGAAVTITLANSLAAAGTGAASTVKRGATVEVVRQDTPNTMYVTVKDAGGATLHRVAVGTRTLYRFDGSAWVQVI